MILIAAMQWRREEAKEINENGEAEDLTIYAVSKQRFKS